MADTLTAVPNNPIGWFEIYVDDMERAINFYQGVLQVSLEQMFEPGESNIQMMGFPSNMEAYGSSGALVHTADMPAGGNSSVVYFNCDDCAVEAARVETFGGKLDRDKMSIGEYGFCAMAIDTEGNMIGLHSMK